MSSHDQNETESARGSVQAPAIFIFGVIMIVAACGAAVVFSDWLASREHKCEYANTYGNFFLETFSNKRTGKLGWFYTNGADFLLYHFLRSGEVYLMKLPALRAWAYQHDVEGVPRIHRYKERVQARHGQLNDTWGYCVKIEDVCAGMNIKTRALPQLLLDEYELKLDYERSLRNGTK